MSTARVEQVFRDVLSCRDDVPLDTLRYGTTPGWDSLAHMQLVTELEEAFDITLESDDIVAMNDFGAVKDVLRRHGVGDVA